MDRRAIASLSGVAPKARESGKFKGKRRIGTGRRHVRKALYMAALALYRQGSAFGGFVKRLQDNGKAAKQILIAIARKLITIANAVIRDQKPFNLPAEI